MLAKYFEYSDAEDEASTVPVSTATPRFGEGKRSQFCLAVGNGASLASDLLPSAYLNPFLDNGCPKSFLGLSKDSKLATSLDIPLHVQPLDYVPFIH